jgi:hypothetical protein
VTSLSFLAEEILRDGEALRYPMREGGVYHMSGDDAARLRERFIENAMELAERAKAAVDARGVR